MSSDSFSIRHICVFDNKKIGHNFNADYFHKQSKFLTFLNKEEEYLRFLLVCLSILSSINLSVFTLVLKNILRALEMNMGFSRLL